MGWSRKSLGEAVPAGRDQRRAAAPTGVRWLSQAPRSGLGDASQAYMSGLREAGIPVTWVPLGWPSAVWNAPYGPLAEVAGLEDAPQCDVVNREIEHDTVVVCSTPLWHEQLAVEADGRRLVAYTAWETDRLSLDAVTVLDHYDRVIVPSGFCARVFESGGLRPPVTVVPHCAPLVRPVLPARSGGTFVFYMIATWTTRKAILEGITAFVSTFAAEDDVELVIHTTTEDQVARLRMASGAESPERGTAATWFTLARALAGIRSAPSITLSTRPLSEAGMAALHERGNCFFSLSHGEAWGLGAFDAGAFGNPAIVTGWGGALEYFPVGYPYLVDYDLIPTATEEPDAWWGPHPGERWAKAHLDHASALLRHVFEHREEASSWGATLQENVYANFSRSQVTCRLVEALASTEPS